MPESPEISRRVAIIGAGPSGLTAGYLLAKEGVPVTIFESDPEHVGGNVRTMERHGCRFDTGGHRFFSDSPRVNRFWREILPDDLLLRPRTSRIRHRGRFFSSPLRPLEALIKLGVPEATRSLLAWVFSPPARNPRSYEEWVGNRFGTRLYSHFFQSYAEKTWGIDCSEIPAEWAELRLRGAGLREAFWNAMVPPERWRIIKRPSQTFLYPRKGAGMMWEACAGKIEALGGALEMGATVTRCAFHEREGSWSLRVRRKDQTESTINVAHVISSVLMAELARMLQPHPPESFIRAASSLRYRDLVLVALMVRDRKRFHDNWLYVHDSRVRVARIQHYKASSPEMVSDPSMVCYGMEYFSSAGDDLWVSRDETLVEMAERELIWLGLASPGEVVKGVVVRQKKALPIHDDPANRHVALIRNEIARRYPALHLVGRSGMHQCGHGDHPVRSAMRCVDEILAVRPEARTERPEPRAAAVLNRI